MPAASNCCLHRVRDRRGERVVERDVGGGLRPLAAGSESTQCTNGDPARQDRRGLHEEHVRQLRGEHGGAAAGRLDERVAVAVRDLRGRHAQQGGERPEHQVDVILRDEVLVVRDRLVRVARVVGELQLDLTAQDPAVRVDRVGPQLVALPGGRARVREVARSGDSEIPITIGSPLEPRSRSASSSWSSSMPRGPPRRPPPPRSTSVAREPWPVSFDAVPALRDRMQSFAAS